MLVTQVERWKAADTKEVAAYLAAPAPATTLALVGEVKPDGALAKAVQAGGEVLTYDVTRRALPRWVAEQFDRAGAKADAAACRALIELVGDDLDELAAEVEKLATWANGEPVTERAVRDLTAGRAETSVFALSDAWGDRDTAAAVAAAEDLLERSDRPRRDAVPRLVGMLVSHVARVRAAQALAAAGTRPREAAALLKVHPFAAEKALAQAQRFSVDELRDVVLRLAQLDHALKGGSRLAPDLELLRAIVEVTEPARVTAR